MKTGAVYVLKDPDSLLPRYVGASTRPQQRFYEHLAGHGANVEKKAWIASLLAVGKRPVFELVKEVPAQDLADAERSHIAILLAVTSLTEVY